MAPQALRQVGCEDAGRRIGQPRVGRFLGQTGGGPRCEEAVGERIGLRTCCPADGNLVGEASQVFDEHDAQRDGDRPQFADRQRLYPLIGGDEPAQHLRIEIAVGMGDERPGQPEHARVPGKRPAG
jgi:hypothetical protein